MDERRIFGKHRLCEFSVMIAENGWFSDDSSLYDNYVANRLLCVVVDFMVSANGRLIVTHHEED
jgi:hypothetical protein